MDPFKLLTKGTKLVKNQTQILPSSGPAHTPQILVDESVPSTGTRGKKRKRPSETPQGQDTAVIADGATVPDFFSTNATEQNPRSQAQQAEKVKPAPQGTTSAVELLEKPFIRRPEDECKQILRSHKLKVTLINPPSSKAKGKQDKKAVLTQITPQPLESFAELRPRFKISRRLASNIAEQGYSVPTEVQLAAIPLLLGGDEDTGLAGVVTSKKIDRSHVDLLSIAPTGSGKTLAFLIPLVQGLLDLKHKDDGEVQEHVKAIILAPTHELADQIVNEARKLVQGTGLRVTGMRKGMQILPADQHDDSNTEQAVKTDILVSTPLALVNAISDESSQSRAIQSVQYLVLDEADVLLDPLFREQTLSIWKSCTNPGLRVSLWSATIGSSIETLAQEVITTRRKDLGLSSKNRHLIRLIAGLKDSSLPTISHRLIYCATESGKLLALRQILHPATSDPSTPSLRPPFLIFTQTIPRASALHSELLYDISPEAGGSSRIAVLHSSLSDTARSEIMTRFRRGEVWILITTDLLSRGVDFRGINGIVNYDIPTTSAAYVHRAGRTGRAGRQGGMAITLYTKEDIPYIKNVANVIAASERVHGKNSSSGVEGGDTIPGWLLDALPDVSKKSKQELKKRGVEARRAGNEKTSRISTKSGFQRGLEKRRKAAVAGTKARRKGEDVGGADEGEDDEWAGIED